MSLLVKFNPPSLTAAQYEEILRRLRDKDYLPAAGLDYHVCSGEDGSLKCIEVWDSAEEFNVFAKRLLPILDAVGVKPFQPEVIQVHNTIKR